MNAISSQRVKITYEVRVTSSSSPLRVCFLHLLPSANMNSKLFRLGGNPIKEIKS